MGFQNRIRTLLKSQFNYWVTHAEDPEKIINQAVQEMEEGLDRVRGKLAALKFRVDERERFLQRIGKQISYWHERAEEFLKDDMEENAKDAVRRRRMLEGEERRFKLKQTEDKGKLKEMETTLEELEGRVQMAKAKRNILLKNIRLGKGIRKGAKERVEECMRIDIDVEDPFSTFHKMEERVEGETEFTYFGRMEEKETREKEQELINEEIERLKKLLKKGGSKK